MGYKAIKHAISLDSRYDKTVCVEIEIYGNITVIFKFRSFMAYYFSHQIDWRLW